MIYLSALYSKSDQELLDLRAQLEITLRGIDNDLHKRMRERANIAQQAGAVSSLITSRHKSGEFNGQVTI